MRRPHITRDEASQRQPIGNRRGLAVLSSLLVPGVGQLMLGRRLRGAIWLAGFVALALLGAAHLLPGLALMVLAGLDAWWVGAVPLTGIDSRRQAK